MARARTSPWARFAIAGLTALLLLPSVGQRSASTAAPPLPTFGNPTISSIQGFGFEQDLRLDTHGRVYTSVPGSLGSNISYVWRSLDGGQTFKWIPAAAQPVGKLVPMCNGGGDTELGTDSADRLYINDLALANYGTARSDDQGRTLTASPTCTSVLTAPDDRPWYAVDGDPLAGGSVTLTYNVAPNATPIALGACTAATAALSNKLVFARSPLAGAPETAGLLFGAPQVLTQGCDEGIMGNDEVFTYGSVKRVFVMHDNDALNQIRMARCDIVPVTVSLTGYANCADQLIYENAGTVNGGDFPSLTIDRRLGTSQLWTVPRHDHERHPAVFHSVDRPGRPLVDTPSASHRWAQYERFRLAGGRRQRQCRRRVLRNAHAPGLPALQGSRLDTRGLEPLPGPVHEFHECEPRLDATDPGERALRPSRQHPDPHGWTVWRPHARGLPAAAHRPPG